MMHSLFRSGFRAALAGCGALALATAFASPAAASPGRHGHDRAHGSRGHVRVHGAPAPRHHARDHRSAAVSHDGARLHRHAPQSLVAPPRMRAEHRWTYARYANGLVYHEPHRHHHRAYLFPVRVSGGVEYRPHYYCGDELVAPRPVRGGLHISLSF